MSENKNYGAMLDVNARSGRGKSAPKVLRSMEIEKAENGGHTVTHRFQNSSEGHYHESESHVFGASEGSKLMDHLKEHLEMTPEPRAEKSAKAESRAEGEKEGDGKSSAGAAY